MVAYHGAVTSTGTNRNIPCWNSIDSYHRRTDQVVIIGARHTVGRSTRAASPSLHRHIWTKTTAISPGHPGHWFLLLVYILVPTKTWWKSSCDFVSSELRPLERGPLRCQGRTLMIERATVALPEVDIHGGHTRRRLTLTCGNFSRSVQAAIP